MAPSIEEKSAPSVNDGSQLGQEMTGDIIEMDQSYTPEEEKGVLRKIDIVILPFMCFVFSLQYLDKQSLSYAAVFGLLTDLDLTASQYSWCSSIFYVGQLVSEYPFIYLMSRLPLTKFVGITVILWGVTCMCLATPQNYAGFVAVRFLLGFTEGAVSPAFVTITSIWYLKKEHAFRTALWVSMNGIAQTIGCLLMYGIGKNTALDLAPWRTLFVISGSITAAAGVGFFVLMPSGPKDAWFLSPREKEVLSLRMAKDREGGDKTSFSISQLKETMLDPKAWCAFMFGVLVTMQSPVLTFATLVIKQRALVIIVLTIPPIVGNVLLLKLPLSAGWGVIVSAWLASCISASMTVLLSLAASNVKGNTKRAVVNTMFFIGYCAGCIGSPQLWTLKPRYTEGVITALVTWCLLIVTVTVYRFLCGQDNKQRDTRSVENPDHAGGEVNLDKNGGSKSDLTDKQDRLFRYSC
ncbi:Fc.00g105030.m01.CDS01 [Cosmosporella sp. VM-42]